MCVSRNDLDEPFIRQWEVLEERALEGNAFLSPNFILPSLKHLTPDTEPVFIAVEAAGARQRELVGLGIFEHRDRSRLLPLPHLRAYRSIHTFCDGLLVDRSCAPEAVSAFFDFFSSMAGRWHGVSFGCRGANSIQSHLMEDTAGRHGVRRYDFAEHERGMLVPTEVTRDYMEALYSRRRQKAFQKERRRLDKLGNVKFELVRCGPDYEERMEAFLRLEAMGWKGSEGSALLSNPNEAAFFREVTSKFAKSSRVFFAELWLNGQQIFSSCNYISGQIGFRVQSRLAHRFFTCQSG